MNKYWEKFSFYKHLQEIFNYFRNFIERKNNAHLYTIIRSCLTAQIYKIFGQS